MAFSRVIFRVLTRKVRSDGGNDSRSSSKGTFSKPRAFPKWSSNALFPRVSISGYVAAVSQDCPGQSGTFKGGSFKKKDAFTV